MRKIFIWITLSLFIFLSFAQTRNLKTVKAPVENQTAERRKAVVIGMSDYGAGRNLNNTLNDADDMVDVLTQLGFEVTLLTNNDLRNLEANLAVWYNTIERNDMAIFYFAGHGVEVGGSNYLIPINAELNSEPDVRYNALSVNKVLDNMDFKQVRFKLLILDACRDNPFTRGWNRSNNEKGLAHINAPKGTLIAFAAAPGAVAHDGGTYNLRNGVFTHYLKQELLTEGTSIDDILNKVAGDVAKLTNDQQLPYKTGILTENFYFKPKTNDRPGTVVLADKPVEPVQPVVQPAVPEKYYYYIDQNDTESDNRFADRKAAESEMKSKKLYGRIYSNAGEVFVVDKPVEVPVPVTGTKENNPSQPSTPTNLKIETPARRFGLQLTNYELIENGKQFMMELSLTNSGQDISSYDFAGGYGTYSYAYDNLGNKMDINIIWGNQQSRPAAGHVRDAIPSNTPIALKVIVYDINPRATLLTQIRINGFAYPSIPGTEGDFIIRNVPLRHDNSALGTTSSESNLQVLQNLKIETPNRIFNLKLTNYELVESSKQFLMELLLTNSGQDISSYDFAGGWGTQSYAYDNLGNKMDINIIWSNQQSRPASGHVRDAIPSNTPIALKVIVYDINPRATLLTQIRINGFAYPPIPGTEGDFIIRNVPLR